MSEFSPAPISNTRLGDLLLKRRLITPEQLERALGQHQLQGIPLGQVLLNDGIIARQDLDLILQEQGWRRDGHWVIH